MIENIETEASLAARGANSSSTLGDIPLNLLGSGPIIFTSWGTSLDPMVQNLKSPSYICRPAPPVDYPGRTGGSPWQARSTRHRIPLTLPPSSPDSTSAPTHSPPAGACLLIGRLLLPLW